MKNNFFLLHRVELSLLRIQGEMLKKFNVEKAKFLLHQLELSLLRIQGETLKKINVGVW